MVILTCNIPATFLAKLPAKLRYPVLEILYIPNRHGPLAEPLICHDTCRRVHEAGPTAVYAEPVVQGAHSSYYARRAASSLDPEGFRRSQRAVPDPGPLRPDR